MILDIAVIVILGIAAFGGRRSGLFRTVARLASLVLAAVGVFLWGDALKEWTLGTPWAKSMLASLTDAVESALESGQTVLIEPFLPESTVSHAAEVAALGIADMILSVLCFVVISAAVRILVEVLDKLVFHLPLVRPVNRILGMAFSFGFTAIILYLVVGALGGLSMYTDNAFFSEQMQSSVLVRGMYENNIVLNFLNEKG